VDDKGVTAYSAPVTVKVSKSMKGVRNNKSSASSILTTQSLKDGTTFVLSSTQTSAITELADEIDQTYTDFSRERMMFSNAAAVENYMFAASFLAHSSASLSNQKTPSSGIADRIKKVSAYLQLCDDLMTHGLISASSEANATSVNAQVNLSIGLPETGPIGALGMNVAPDGIAKITALGSQRFSTQTVGSQGGDFELANVSVTLGGVAAKVLTVSPTEITVSVPSGVPGGLAEILVTSREGFLSHGVANVEGLNPRIFAVKDDTGGQGVVVDSFNSKAGMFSTTSPWQLLDSRTRLSILATGLTSGLNNTDTTNDVWLPNGKVLQNLAEAVTVEARTANGKVYNLKVEYAGAQGQLRGVDQVNVVLVPELAGAGEVQLTVIAGGTRSNTVSTTID